VDRSERNRLVVDNLPLVGYLVTELCSRATHLSRDDLASAGALALVHAAGSFDSSLGVPFGAFARRRIVGAFADEMRAQDWATRSARKRIRETLAVQETLTAALGRTPSVDEIATALGVDRQEATDALTDAGRSVSSLDETIGDTIAAEITSPEEAIVSSERGAFLRAAIEALPEKMRYVVEQIYFEDRTVKELAEELGATHSAVSQQRSEAVRLLRDGLSTHFADEPDEQPELVSRVAPSRRNAYLARLAEYAELGIAQRITVAPALQEQAVAS
jgi:RNA polymerase sigma factor for flagellar operon FliA